MQIKDIHKSKTVRGIVIGIAGIIVLLVVFHLGQISGYHRARYAEHLGENFNRNFSDPRGGWFPHGLSDRGLPPGGHGAVGEIVSLSLPQFIVAGPDNLEKTIIVSTSTKIREFQEEIKPDDLQKGSRVVVLGEPNDSGQIQAQFIRVIPVTASSSAIR